ncbi:MAG: VCBS repeat-containing protein, partial [Acidimicrobiia bacterium]|nr:VCBS repeat-containing protein [Acidimicrobiia bacterium]
MTVTDPDDLDLASATVQITGGTFANDFDTLSATGNGTIAVSYDSTTETLTLTGSDTLTDYQSVLQTVTFNAGENPTDFGSNPTRTLTWTLDDGSSSFSTGTATSTVSVTSINDAPTLTGVPLSVQGTPSSTVSLASSVSITDPDDVFLKDATVAITGGTFAGDGDVLQAEGTSNGNSIQNGHTISIAYNSATETLTLTGTDTLADYQNVLDTVTWHSTAADPTHGGSNTTRTLSWTVQDISGTLNGGSDTSTPQTETLTIDQPPALTGLVQTAQWTEEQSPLATTLSPAVTITDADGINTQLSATVSITGGTFNNDHDTLAINGSVSGTLDGGNIAFSYNSTTETLTLTGSDTLAAYQNALDGVTFNAGENPTNYGSDPTRTLTWTVADHVGVESAPVTTTIDITQVNDPPTLSGLTTASWTEEQSPATTTLSPNASVSDPDNLALVSATVSITGGAFTGDELLVSGQTSGTKIVGTNITPTFTGNGTVTFSGSDTLADYQSALQLVTYQGGENPTDFGSDPTRTVTWTLNDGQASFATGTFTSTIDVTRVNDAPTLAVASSASWTEEGANATLAPGAAVTDVDDLTLTGATVQIASGGLPADQLEVFDTTLGTAQTSGIYSGTNVTYSYNSTTQTLALSGTDTITDYNQVLDHVVFTSGENPTNFGSDLTRLVTWQVNDGGGTANNGVQLSSLVTTTVSVTNVNDPPTLSLGTTTAQWTEEQSPAATTLSPTVTVTDPDNLDLVSATVSITGGAFTGDELLVSGQTSGVVIAGTNITPTFTGNGTVTFSGSDTLADYQSALELVTYNGGENPTDFGSDPTRTLTWTLNDGGSSNNLSTAVTSTINITNINDAPTLSGTSNASFTEEGGAVTLSGSVAVGDPDDINLSGATVKIVGGTFANDQDVLSANTAGTGITASYNSSTETLTLSGIDTLGHYQSVLDTVTFNAGENPNDYGSNPTRTVTWTVMDPSGTANGGVNVSAPVTTTVSITNVNDPPTLSNVASSAAVGHTFQTITISPSASASDPDNLKLASATVQITGGTFAGDGDQLAATTTGTGIAASYNSSTETLTLTGSDTLAHYSQVLDSVTFNSTTANATNSGADRTRTVTWTLNDGSGSNNLSAPAVTTIKFQNAVHYDFNGDSVADFAFQQEAFNAGGATGTPQIWLWNGTAVTSMTTLTNPGAAWHIVASADVNGDGKSDLIWQASNGQPGIWLMNGSTVTAEVGLTDPGADWHLIASGDFNGDGMSDLLFQESGGTLGVWLMNGTTPIAEAAIGNPGPTWIPVGTADFNGDGKDDILLQNKTTG